MIARATRRHAEKSFLIGPAAKIAADIQPYVEAGVTWVGVLDFMPMLQEPAESAAALARSIEVCRLLKQA